MPGIAAGAVAADAVPYRPAGSLVGGSELFIAGADGLALAELIPYRSAPSESLLGSAEAEANEDAGL